MEQAEGLGVSSSSIWETFNQACEAPSREVLVQGKALRTWSYLEPATDCVQIEMETDGRPLEALLELWQGPDNTPQMVKVYVEDGSQRSFRAVLQTPRSPSTIAIRNTAEVEFPMKARVTSEVVIPVAPEPDEPKIVQGGAVRTFPFDHSVDLVEVELTTDGRPLNARLELLQGPNNNKQVMEVYSESGAERPFHALIETPGHRNVLRVVNTATLEYPITVSVGVAGSSSLEFDNNQESIVMNGGKLFGFQTQSVSQWTQEAQR